MKYEFDWSVIFEYRHLLWDGLILTLQVASASLFLSIVIGSAIGTLRHFSPRWMAWAVACYIEFFRNIPPIVQLFFWYFAVGLNSFNGAVIGLAIYSSTYIGEVIRSGYRSVPKTHIEAARSSGLSFMQMIRYVIFPQAVMRMVPALSVEFINVIKNSSLAMTLGVMELTFQTQEINALTFRGFEAATAVTIIYIIIAFTFIFFMHAIERALNVEVRSG